ncbi:MAG: tetratricopeptide repeat protein [Ignavibacteriae bacterium]|nr:MAG: tetratricopeptide repeat protein [Ignavibacteriota bacterium]
MKITIPGRAAAASTISSALAAWRSGRGDVIFISGESGSGKSHVLDQIEALREQTPKPSIVRVDCSPPIGSFNVATIQPLQPFGHAIEQLYLNGEATAKKRLALNIGMSVLASIPIAGDIFYAVKAISQDVSEYKRETAAMQQKKRAAVAECVETLERIAAETPFILLVDDGHWSDPQSVEVIQRLRATIKNIPLLIIWTVTPTLAQQSNMPLAAMLRDTEGTPTVSLGDLDRTGSDDVLAAVAPDIRPTEQQRSVLYDRTAGTPGIIAEYVRYLVRTEQVRSDGTIAPDALEKSGLKLGDHPATDVLLHEIADDDAMTLALCAAEGREFTAFMIAALMNTDVISVVRTLRRLQHQTGVIKSVGMRTRYGLKTTAYEFTQSVAFTYFAHYPEYEERKHLHQRIAEILTKEFESSDLDEVRGQISTLIAAHSIEAEDTATASRMFAVAATAADVMGASDTADRIRREHLHINLDAEEVATLSVDGQQVIDGGSAGGGGSESFQELSGRLAQLIVDGECSNARTEIEAALQQRTLTGSERSTLLCLVARAHLELHSFADAEHALRSAEQLPDLGKRDTCNILNMQAAILMKQGRTDEARKVLNEATRHSRQLPLAHRVLTLGNIYLLLRSVHDPLSERFARKLRELTLQNALSGIRSDLQL